MTPSQLLARIEALEVVDTKYLEKIRKQIDDPKRVVKTKAMVKYLLEKKQIDKKQAKALLEPPTEDEMEVVQQAPDPNDFDSSTLLGVDDYRQDTPPNDDRPAPAEPVAAEPVEAVEVEAVEVVEVVEVEAVEVEALDQTIMDQGQFESPQVEMVDVQPVQQAFADPLAMDGGFGSSDGYADSSAKPDPDSKPVATFKGKRDQTDQFKTKWLFIGPMVLCLVIGGIVLLAYYLTGQSSEALLKAANESYNRGSWADANNKITKFLEDFPGHADTQTLKAKQVNAVLRAKFESRSYDEMLKQAKLKLAELAADDDNKLSVIREDLGVILPRGLDEIAQKSADRIMTGEITDISAMESALGQIVEHKTVIDNPVYIPGSQKKSQLVADVYSRIENNKRLIEGLIGKEKDFEAALANITEMREQSKTDDAFNDYRKLIRNYPDLAARKPLIDLMLTISKKESELVQPIQIDREPVDQWRPSLISQSVVLSAPTGKSLASLEGEVVPFIADGSAYGINAGNGTVVWRRFVGQETTMAPVPLDPSDPTITLYVNQRDHDLVCVKTQTGELIWRQEFGEPFRSPAIGPNHETIIVSTESGKLVQLDAVTGAVLKATQLPQAAGPTALIGSRDSIVYQIGKYSNLYALDGQSFECLEVYSLGHYPGSISIPPIQWSGFLLVAINGGESCDLHVLKPQKNGVDIKLVQIIPDVLNSPISFPFVKAGNSYMVVGDNGQVNLLGIDATNETSPIQSQTKQLMGERGAARPFVSAKGSNVWLASNGIFHARIRRAQGKITRETSIQGGDQFLMAAQKLDDYVFHVRRRNGSGMLSASLADSKKLTEVWRTDFGGELVGGPIVGDNSITAVSNQGDIHVLQAVQLQSNQSSQPTRSSDVIQNLRFGDLFQFEDGLAAIGVPGTEDFMFAGQQRLKLTQLAPPANKPACRPLQLNEQLIVASTTGYIARVNPTNGRLVGTPFQTAITPESVVNWLPPVRVGENQIAVAIGETKTEANKLFLLSTAEPRKISLLAEVESEFPFKGELNVLGDQILTVVAGEDADTLVTYDGRTLAEVSKKELSASVAEGPWPVNDGFLAKMDNDQLAFIGSDLATQWSASCPNIQLAGVPMLVDQGLMICFKSGKVSYLDPTSGQEVGGFDIGQPVVNRTLIQDTQIIFSGADGTVHFVNLADTKQ